MTLTNKTTRRLDRITREQTAFRDFEDLMTARGNYRPTIELSNWDRVVLAHHYDAEQIRRGSELRAYTYCNDGMLQASIEACHELALAQNILMDEMIYGPNDCIDVWSNQAEREAYVLAVIDKDLILEYEMPNGSSALLQFTVKNRKLTRQRNVNYNNVPRRWINAIREAGMTNWLGMGQRSATRIPFPAE